MEQSQKSYEANSDLSMYPLKRPIFKLVIALVFMQFYFFMYNSCFL